MTVTTDLHRYLFDLQGYLHLPGALATTEVASANAAIDAIPLDVVGPGDYWGAIHREPVEPIRGVALQQVYEDPAFRSWIDHPSWIDLVRTFTGPVAGDFDGWYGNVFIDENFVSLRGPSEAIGLHAGGHTHTKRTMYRYHRGAFMCMQVNILVALNDIGLGDGATMVIPASHKANVKHPEFDQHLVGDGASCDGVTGAVEVHLQAGDAILFTDALSHGSAMRINAGERRIAVFRYSPAFTTSRFGYVPSKELLGACTEAQRQIIWPFRETPTGVQRRESAVTVSTH